MRNFISHLIDSWRFHIIKKDIHKTGLDVDGDLLYFRGECYYVNILQNEINRVSHDCHGFSSLMAAESKKNPAISFLFHHLLHKPISIRRKKDDIH